MSILDDLDAGPTGDVVGYNALDLADLLALDPPRQKQPSRAGGAVSTARPAPSLPGRAVEIPPGLAIPGRRTGMTIPTRRTGVGVGHSGRPC